MTFHTYNEMKEKGGILRAIYAKARTSGAPWNLTMNVGRSVSDTA